MVAEPMVKVALNVLLAPTIGSEPDTDEAVLIAVTANEAISPEFVRVVEILPATQKVFEEPAGIVIAEPMVALWLASSTRELPICTPVEASIRTTPAKSVSTEGPWRCTVTLLMVTGAPLAVTVKAVYGTRAASSGAIVGAGEVILLPLDILKVKYQTKKAADQGLSFLEVWKKENPFKGLTMTGPRNIIGSFALFGSREGLRGYGVNADIANIISTSLSIVLPSPLDVIKTRMQASSQKIGALEMIKITYNTEGVSAFFKGSLAKVLTQGPKVIVCLGIVDRIEPEIPKLIQKIKKWWNENKKNLPNQFGKSSHRLFKPVENEEPKIVEVKEERTNKFQKK